ncbi:MAG: hypothetical protein VB934_15930 [Polyangiaceae bacterium]
MADDEQPSSDPAQLAPTPDPESNDGALSGDFPELSDLPEIARLLDGGRSDDDHPALSDDIAQLLQLASSRRPAALPKSEPDDDAFIEVPRDMLDNVAEVLGRSAPVPSAANHSESALLDSTAPLRSSPLPHDTGRPSQGPAPKSVTIVGQSRPSDRTPAQDMATPPSESSESAPPTHAQHWTVPVNPSGTHDSAPLPPSDVAMISHSPIRGGTAPTTERLYHARRRGDPIELLAEAIRLRVTGALHFEGPGGTERTVVLRDGDIVTASSDAAEDSLVEFLVVRGDVTREIVAVLPANKLPLAGRRAAAALIARGFLGPDDLWPALRAHAEWLICRAFGDGPATCQLNSQLPDNLRDEPNVFGGAAGIEVFVEAVRRTLEPSEALRRLGAPDRMVHSGPFLAMVTEAALPIEELQLVRSAAGHPLSSWLGTRQEERAPTAYAITALHILQLEGDVPTIEQVDEEPAPESPPGVVAKSPEQQHALSIRQRVCARRSLVDDGDYFSVLGVSSDATSYEIRRAFVDGRRLFEPRRLLTAATADLADDVIMILELLEEAYEVLRDPVRRESYRNAIQASHERLASHAQIAK